ncbi:MAG: hypothetical protein C5S47_01160 [Candidatus Methanogasteraceae archaeon]|nr:MAG: hypothetical protein C5S47_01160 [ANME-2 cluster archaeon]
MYMRNVRLTPPFASLRPCALALNWKTITQRTKVPVCISLESELSADIATLVLGRKPDLRISPVR